MSSRSATENYALGIGLIQEAQQQVANIPTTDVGAVIQLLQQAVALLGTAKVGAPVQNRPAGYTGQARVATAGVPQQLPAVNIPDGFALLVRGRSANTGNITLGFSKGDAFHLGTSFYTLTPGQTVTYYIQNANFLWMDSFVNGEGVELTCEQGMR